MQSQTLSDSRIDDIRERLSAAYGSDPIPEDALVRYVEYEDGVLTVDGDARFYYDGDILLPLLSQLLDDNFLPRITVDMGAVEPVVTGADVMVPGVVGVDRFDDDAVVSVVDEDHGKPLAVTETAMDSETVKERDSGVAASSLHYVGDKLWDEFCG